MTCPFLEYRSSDDEHDFDHERPFCAVQGEFVSPMKADICNDRYDFDHAEHCDVFSDYVDRANEAIADDD